MINESHTIINDFKGMSIDTKDWHREYKSLPVATSKTPCIRIWIEDNSAIPGFDKLDGELVSILRKYGNNQNTFPAFNISPLFRITNNLIIKELEKITKDYKLIDIDKIKSWCTEDNWRNSLIKKINNCFSKSAVKLQEFIEQFAPNQENSMTALLNSIYPYTFDGAYQFRENLETCIFSQLQAKENVETALTLLFYKGKADAKNPQTDNGTLSIILDYAGWQKYRDPVASETTTEWTNSVLLQSEITEEDISINHRTDAFGIPLGNISEPMPNVKLSGFDVTLRAMFHEQLCQKRYGTFDDDSFPVSKQSRNEVKQALEYISAPDKEDITWKKVDSKEIVFAYPSKLTAIPLKFVSILGPISGNKTAHSEIRFRKCAEDFIRAFDGLEPQNKPDHIRIFSIRKMDKARSKIVFTRNLSPDWYINCAERWQAGCENIPDIQFVEPETPYPLSIARIINPVWKPNGELATQGKTTVKRIQYYQGMELLIDEETESELRYFLNILLSNSQGLFSFYGNQSPRKTRTQTAQKLFPNSQRSIAEIWPLFGLLLYKGKCEKEKYMEDVAYLVGQLLKISDELHALYCQIERSGDIPPQLAGNAMFNYTSETPVKAIAVLSQRMNPYIAWAKQYRTKSKEFSWKAGWLLWLYEGIATNLHNMLNESPRFNEFEKAQLFLGYLAALPKRETNNGKEDNMPNESNDNTNFEEINE